MTLNGVEVCLCVICTYTGLCTANFGWINSVFAGTGSGWVGMVPSLAAAAAAVLRKHP